MSFSKRFVMGLCLCLSTTSLPAMAAELKVGVYPFSPYFTVSEGAEIGGVWKERLDKILNKLGHTPSYAVFPPPRLAKNIILGRTDVTISAHHIAVDGHVHYSQRPIADITLNAYHKPNRPAVSSIKDMTGKSVIVIRGYAYNGLIKDLKDPANKITLIEAVTHTEALKRLKRGHADYLLDYRFPTENAFEPAGVSSVDFDSNKISQYSVYYVVSKKTEGAADLAEKLNNSLK